jgi:hypothetical protein
MLLVSNYVYVAKKKAILCVYVCTIAAYECGIAGMDLFVFFKLIFKEFDPRDV